ncbi:MAG TPA: hypothetical protein VF337_01945 [Candidatus Limnocylindrales bacterium]
MPARHFGTRRVSPKEIAELAEAVVDRLTAATDTALLAVETPDLQSAMATICGLLGVETPTTVTSVALLGRADWARRSIQGVLPTLRILEDLWQQDEAPDPLAGAAMGRIFGPLVGNTAVDLAEWELGDFDVQLCHPHDPGVVALPIENLVSLSESWALPLPAVTKWAVACSLSSRLLLSRELLGDRLSRLALRYRLEMGAFFENPIVSDLLGGSGPLDVDRLMGARTPRQQALGMELSRLACAIDCVGLLAWRLIDPGQTQVLEDQLVEALRRHRVDMPRSGVVAEFWLGVPLGPVVRPKVLAIVQRLAGSPAGLAPLWLDRNLLDRASDDSTIATAPVIPGKPRLASLASGPRREIPEGSLEYRKLRAGLEAALAGPLSEAQAEVMRGRLDGLSTTPDLQSVASITTTADNYRSGLITSWLQLWLIANGATLDRRLELATTVYAAVVASPQNGPLLESRVESDLLRLHTRAIIQVERRNEFLESGTELACFAWLGSIASVDIGPNGLLSWQRARQHRLQAAGR